jgi:glycosyltransferase involved in cell wall biosynthesis
MRILYAAPGYKPAYRIGGPIVSIAKAAEGLVRHGHEVTVFATNCNLDQDLDVPVDQPIDVEGVRVWYFRREEPVKRFLHFVPYLSRSMGVLYAPQMRREIDRQVPSQDVVHTQLPFAYPTWAVGAGARRWTRPLFYQQRGVFDPERLRFRSVKKRIIIRLLERPLMQAAAALIALTSSEVASYRALGAQGPCEVIPNGVEVAEYRTEAPKGSAILTGTAADDLVILFLGRLHPIKGADRLLEAFLQIGPRFPKARLIMAGPDEWGLQKAFESRVRASGCGDRVAFPGMVTGESKLDLLARANVFCLPSDGEGFSIAVLEALASATAVLLSPGCHFPEAEAAGAGWIVEATAEALADRLSALLAQPGLLREMGTRGRELVLRSYSWERVVNRLEDVYREGLDRCSRSLKRGA